MTEDEARTWIQRNYGAAAEARLEALCALVCAEANVQNLVSTSTLASIWNRHIVDSTQLIAWAQPQDGGLWLDIVGSGAGFPGLVIAALGMCEIVLVEPRKRRAAFLNRAIDALKLARTTVACCKVEELNVTASVISARAVAPLSSLFDWASPCSTPTTRWVLPKGKTALEELESAKQAWQGAFHVEHSLTDPASRIVVATGVRRR